MPVLACFEWQIVLPPTLALPTILPFTLHLLCMQCSVVFVSPTASLYTLYENTESPNLQ